MRGTDAGQERAPSPLTFVQSVLGGISADAACHAGGRKAAQTTVPSSVELLMVPKPCSAHLAWKSISSNIFSIDAVHVFSCGSPGV